MLAYLRFSQSLVKHHSGIYREGVRISTMSLHNFFVISISIAFVVPDQNYSPDLKELTNGVLVMDEGFVLQGGGSAHALIKLNVSNLKTEVSKSCFGAKLLSKFVITYDKNKKRVRSFLRC